jgi:NADPH-dependent glutamate synthase beta subunit-like oxidoreductase
MMRYGIPEYRLDRAIVDDEIQIVKSIGVRIETGKRIDTAIELLEGHDAALIAVGAQKGSDAGHGVSDFANAWLAVDYCRLVCQGDAPSLGKSLVVLGGGNVAIDCARTAKKAGVETVRVACLESAGAMIADDEEISAGLAEGIEIVNNFSCSDVIREGLTVTAVRGVKVKSFRFGANGLELEAEPGSELDFTASSLILAMGQKVGLDESFGINLGPGGRIIVDNSMQASVNGVFAAGDAVTGTKSIVEAIASARAVSSEMDRFLGGDGVVDESYVDNYLAPACIGPSDMPFWGKRLECAAVSEEARLQAKRCLQCDLRLQIAKPRIWTDPLFSRSRKKASV